MGIIKMFFSLLLSAIFLLTGTPNRTLRKKAENFRLTSYVIARNFSSESGFDSSHFDKLTDVILIDISDFNEAGEVILSDNFDNVVESLKEAMSESQANLYLNLIGPGSQTDSDVWEDQMNSMAERHNIAFASGVLEENIKVVLEQYEFDGVFFDYEYPLGEDNWKKFDDFLYSLDKTLGDEYKIGAAISPWICASTRKGVKALDMVEVMAYDMWDEDGTHASFEGAKSAIKQMFKYGFSPEQLDLGLPFYARPTTQEAYWYDYASYYDKIDENGLYFDENTGLTFSFNDYETIYNKTEWAIKAGLGGVMVWHYSCDLPATNGYSLFNAMYAAKTDMITRYSSRVMPIGR
jgi:GH18 family chitinase